MIPWGTFKRNGWVLRSTTHSSTFALCYLWSGLVSCAQFKSRNLLKLVVWRELVFFILRATTAMEGIAHLKGPLCGQIALSSCLSWRTINLTTCVPRGTLFKPRLQKQVKNSLNDTLHQAGRKLENMQENKDINRVRGAVEVTSRFRLWYICIQRCEVDLFLLLRRTYLASTDDCGQANIRS